ncbi:4'-phosphopantetheinyl transferase AcpT [Kluyvera genomosp. 1]|uniref:4'-phosphopantetheinyl transferase AcpT n=1 Tax=Kluyvera genomosp. 1 TaxID=2774053 RepID=UPI0006900706|nr:4'-phosphopantetheinyl transferase AcpT [Kluyvera genomosp. 1]
MYRLFLGKISQLSGGQLPPAVAALAPTGPGRAGWLAGRVLLSQAISPLPEIVYGALGKPAFPVGSGLWFNLSHSGDEIALLLSDEGDVGCDIEAIRPRKNWPALVESLFTPAEQAYIAAEESERQLAAFWRIWTRKEAIIKQRGGSVWQMADVQSTCGEGQFIADNIINGLSIAVCTPTRCHLDDIIHLLQ